MVTRYGSCGQWLRGVWLVRGKEEAPVSLQDDLRHNNDAQILFLPILFRLFFLFSLPGDACQEQYLNLIAKVR